MHTRLQVVTSIVTSILTVTYLCADGFAATAASAKTPAIGMVTASGRFILDRSEVWGNATLFDGGKIETSAASSEAALRNGVRIQLASASSATVGEHQLTLTKGAGQVAATEDYQVSAGNLAIRSASGSSRLRVAWLAGGAVEVTALSGAARVANRAGLVLASIPAGRRMNFAVQAALGVVTRTGCLLSKDGRFLMQDQNTQEVVEVRGNDLAPQVGNRVTVTGTASAIRPAVTIASSVLNINTLTLQETGGCLSVAAALDAQTEPTNARAGAGPAPNQPAVAPAKAPVPAPNTGMSTGAKVALVAVIGGGGAGAAIALAGKKKSTSP
ncbi:MAG: hypothetical protein ABI833_06100 [Acidobacteriota bacterium]